jgi:hypothetical protein
MNLSISKLGRRLLNSARVLNGTIDPDQCVEVTGIFRAQVIRDGQVIKDVERRNIVVRQGLNRIAFRNANYTNSIANYLAIGTQTAAHSLDSTQAGIGEVSRKIAVSAIQSREWFSVVATWAGNADSLTGILIDTGAICDYANSAAGSGIIYNASNGLGVTLQASDFLNLTAAIRCGSHNLSQST